MDFLNSGGGGMGFSAPPRNDRAGFGGGNRGFDFSQFPQFGQGYGSALSGGTNGYFGKGFGNENFGQGFGQSPWSGGGMSGGNDGQGFNTSGNFSQFTNPQQNIASPYGLTPPAGGFAPIPNDFPGLNQPPPGQSVAEMAQQNNAPPGFGGHAFGTNFTNGNAPEGFYAAQQNYLDQTGNANPLMGQAMGQGSMGQAMGQGPQGAQPLPQTQGPSLSGRSQSINIGQGPSGLNTMNGYSGQDLGHGYATPKAYGPQYGSNIGQGQGAPAPTANQGYVNQFMTQKNTAPNIGRRSYLNEVDV